MTWFAAYIALAWTIRMLMVPVILRRQFAPGASLAWLTIIFLHPYIGLALYTLLGEKRLGPHRVQRHREIVRDFRSALRQKHGRTRAAEIDLPLRYEPMVLQAEKISGLPALPGNTAEFLTTPEAFIARLVQEIDAATSHVHLLYYIFARDAFGTPVVEALKRAVARGVHCRVLVDAVASRPFFFHRGLDIELEKAGVHVVAALPAHFIQRRLPRMDLRNHRKLAVIDTRVALIGSHNVINPMYDGRKGAPWVDVTGVLAGPVVAELAAVFAEDWAFETDEKLDIPSPGPLSASCTPMQVVPTGPAIAEATYRRVLLGAVQCATSRLTLTTPYFVPDEPTLVALIMAADRGVEVKLILPETPDHFFTAAAGRAHFARLMAAGIQIHLYKPGLLHAKTVTVDDALAVFGSANLDVRSFNLNFELSVLMYGRDVTDRLRAIQHGYLDQSRRLDPSDWSRRPRLKRYADAAITLLSPLL